MGLDWRWAPGASRALRRATNEDNFELPTYSAPERWAGAKNLPTYFWLPRVQSYSPGTELLYVARVQSYCT